EALERDPDERVAFLDAACADDPDLRREVASYLTHEEQARALLDPGASTFAGDLLEAWQQDLLKTNAGSLTGHSIGPYRVAELIGRGGMGLVYRARRGDVNLHVAIKTIHPVLAPPEHVRRLEAESQTLARLEHPN